MSLPFCRLALTGEEPHEWAPLSPEWISQYLQAKARHIAALRKKRTYTPKPKRPLSMTPCAFYARSVRDGTFVRRPPSQTKTAIRLRARRSGMHVPKTKDEIRAIQSNIAPARAIKGWHTRKSRP